MSSFYDGGFYRQRRSGFYGEARRGGPSSADIAASLISHYGTPAFYLGDPNPARLMPSGLSQNYLESTGLTAASASGQTIGLQLDRSLGAAIGAELLTNGGFDADSDWTKGTGWTISGGVASHAAGSSSNLSQSRAFVTGKTYRVSYTISGATAGTAAPILSGGATVSGTGVGTNGLVVQYLTATANHTAFSINGNATFNGAVDNVSVKEVAGNHAYQTTAADEPALILDSGLWRLRGDGVSDNLLTTLVPAASMTLMVAVEFNAGSDIAFGATEAVGANRCEISVNSSGLLSAGVGGHSEATINGGSDIRDIPGVAALVFNGTTVKLFWKPHNGSISKIYDAAQTGAPTSTIPLRLLARNLNGTAAEFLDGDIYRALAQQSAYTDGEIATIAAQWARELGWAA